MGCELIWKFQKARPHSDPWGNKKYGSCWLWCLLSSSKFPDNHVRTVGCDRFNDFKRRVFSVSPLLKWRYTEEPVLIVFNFEWSRDQSATFFGEGNCQKSTFFKILYQFKFDYEPRNVHIKEFGKYSRFDSFTPYVLKISYASEAQVITSNGLVLYLLSMIKSISRLKLSVFLLNMVVSSLEP